MKPIRPLLLLLAVMLTLGISSCKKEDLDRDGLSHVNGVPYYHFTDADRPWLQAKQGDEWRFENARGYQRVYQVTQIVQQTRAPRKTPSGLLTAGVLQDYYDRITVQIGRTDSLRQSGELNFYRDAALTNPNSGGTDPATSQLYADGNWYEFVGDIDRNKRPCGYGDLAFLSGGALSSPFKELTVRGRQYKEVVACIGNTRALGCFPLPRYYLQELYYDRQAGLVRMVSRAGEVWDRVP